MELFELDAPALGTIVLIALILLGIVTAMKGIRQVPQGEVWTVQRFGAFTRLLSPGLNFIIPYIDTIGRRINVQEVVLDIPEQAVITRDNATVSVDGIVCPFNSTVVVGPKLVPRMTTPVPPVDGPVVGERLVNDGAWGAT